MNIFGDILLREGGGGGREFVNVVAEKVSGLFSGEGFGVDGFPNGVHNYVVQTRLSTRGRSVDREAATSVRASGEI